MLKLSNYLLPHVAPIRDIFQRYVRFAKPMRFLKICVVINVVLRIKDRDTFFKSKSY